MNRLSRFGSSSQREHQRPGIRRFSRPVVTLCALTLSTLPLSACSAQEASTNIPEVDSSKWSNEFDFLRQIAKESQNEQFILGIIDDGKISDEEALQALSKQEQCVRDKGFSEFAYYPDGALKVPDHLKDKPEQWMHFIDECTTETAGYNVFSIWQQMQSNPLNIDQNEYLAMCLIKLKVVEPSLTGADIQKEYDKSFGNSSEPQTIDGHPLQGLPFIVSQDQGVEAVNRCNSEPEKIIYGNEAP